MLLDRIAVCPWDAGPDRRHLKRISVGIAVVGGHGDIGGAVLVRGGAVIDGAGGVVHVSHQHGNRGRGRASLAVADGVGEGVAAGETGRRGIGDRGARVAGRSMGGLSHGGDREWIAVGIAVVIQHIHHDARAGRRRGGVVDRHRRSVRGAGGIEDFIGIAALETRGIDGRADVVVGRSTGNRAVGVAGRGNQIRVELAVAVAGGVRAVEVVACQIRFGIGIPLKRDALRKRAPLQHEEGDDYDRESGQDESVQASMHESSVRQSLGRGSRNPLWCESHGFGDRGHRLAEFVDWWGLWGGPDSGERETGAGKRENGRAGCRPAFQSPNEVRRPAPGPGTETGARERGRAGRGSGRTGCRPAFQSPNEVRRPAPGPENGRAGARERGRTGAENNSRVPFSRIAFSRSPASRVPFSPGTPNFECRRAKGEGRSAKCEVRRARGARGELSPRGPAVYGGAGGLIYSLACPISASGCRDGGNSNTPYCTVENEVIFRRD